MLQDELPAKRLELLKEFLPGVRKVAVLADSSTKGQLAATVATAKRLRGRSVEAKHIARSRNEIEKDACSFCALSIQDLVAAIN